MEGTTIMTAAKLAGKVAVVTGASSGIGEATARALAAEGVQVVAAARRKDRLQALQDDLCDAFLPVACDVADQHQVAQLFAQVQERFGGLDLLVNNAGRGANGPFALSSPADWRTQIDVNLLGVLNCTHAAIPLMTKRSGAMIASVGSVAGRQALPLSSVYSATKFALVGFHDALRKELSGEGIRVALVEPGAVWTEWGVDQPDIADQQQAYRDAVDALQADDVAQAILYAFAQPPRVLVQNIMILPTKQAAP